MYRCEKGTLNEIWVRTCFRLPRQRTILRQATLLNFISANHSAKHQSGCLLIHKITNDQPSPVSCGEFRSKKDGTLTPIMMTLEAMSDVVLEVMTCNCQRDCQTGWCAYKKRGLRSTILYHKRLKYSQKKCRNMEDGWTVEIYFNMSNINDSSEMNFDTVL